MLYVTLFNPTRIVRMFLHLFLIITETTSEKFQYKMKPPQKTETRTKCLVDMLPRSTQRISENHLVDGHVVLDNHTMTVSFH